MRRIEARRKNASAFRLRFSQQSLASLRHRLTPDQIRGESALDDPAFGQDHKSLGLIGTLDDFSLQMREHARQDLVEFGSLIAAAGEELFQERKHPEQGRHDQNVAVAILNISRMDDGMKQQAQCADENVPLFALDLLSSSLAKSCGVGERMRFAVPDMAWNIDTISARPGHERNLMAPYFAAYRGDGIAEGQEYFGIPCGRFRLESLSGNIKRDYKVFGA